MASSLSIAKSNALHPTNRETVFCKTLVVGNTVAAYTATLAILQAGGQVCWAQTGKLNLTHDLSQLYPDSSFSWRWGRRVTAWERVIVMSRSQQTFWANWQPQAALTAAGKSASESLRDVESKASVSFRETQLRQAIAPYLQNQQLILIPQGIPIRVLYSESRGQRRVHQVVFQDAATQRFFQVHAKLILDATRNADLQQNLSKMTGAPVTPELILTREDLDLRSRIPHSRTLFEDAITVVLANGTGTSTKAHPLSIPLRSLVPENTEGFLCVTFPGCESSLRSIFRHPRSQWALGEAVGHIAVQAARVGGLGPLMSQPNWQWQLQQILVRQGIPIFAFDDVPLNDADFEAIQMGAIADVVRTSRRYSLSFRPETPVTRAVLASALSRLLGTEKDSVNAPQYLSEDVSTNHWAKTAIQRVIAFGWMTEKEPGRFAPSTVVTKCQLWQILCPLYPSNGATPPFSEDDTPVRRRHLSRSLYPIMRSRFEG
ncbi:S-layer homology domain-containing protein [Oscillatoria sp. CS-180]|uniref:S-layer homology domain-containing protein n=1 Tax=Oscillatoria sp. CS-180 TaxID=3021720 RepID=UPI00232B862C|nr:S-layer homology domain-containing protein [Oscillatoria sp. CS-180]MDB9526000.1 S-layer homology domain-containing protein [Oscillatoria sp. CS-180]